MLTDLNIVAKSAIRYHLCHSKCDCFSLHIGAIIYVVLEINQIRIIYSYCRACIVCI